MLKKSWRAEILLLTLPAIVIVGLAIWLSRKQNHNAGKARIAKYYVWHRAPYDAAIDIHQNDTIVEMVSEMWATVNDPKNPVPLKLSMPFKRDAKPEDSDPANRELRTGLESGLGPGVLGPLDTTGVANPTQFHIGIDTRKVPATSRAVWLRGDFTGEKFESIPYRIDVRPRWLVGPSLLLKAGGISAQKNPAGKGWLVEATVTYTGTKPFVVRGQTAKGWFPRRARPLPIIYNGAGTTDEIVAHWSQRLESADGTYNSLTAMEETARQAGSEKRPALIQKFEPKVVPYKLKVNKNKLTVTYWVTSLPQKNLQKKLLFKTDIGVMEDGFLEMAIGIGPGA